MNKNFSTNLRRVCAEHGSISSICREIGINRQQFNRYVNGAGIPSAHNMLQITRFFGLAEADLFSEPDVFAACLAQEPAGLADGPGDFLMSSFRDQAKRLRRHLGFYHSYFRTPTWPGMIMCSLVKLYEADGHVMTKTIERVTSEDGATRHRSRYKGMVTLRGNHIFIVEREVAHNGTIIETILTTSHRVQSRFLFGVGVSVAGQKQAAPYASRCVYRRLEEHLDIRAAVKACGVYPGHSRLVDPKVRTHLGAGKNDQADDETGALLA